MRIVDASQINLLTAARHRFAFVEQYSYSHVFESGNHANGVVIS
jgi:hypothetical protein